MQVNGGGAERIPLQISRDCVVASIQVDLDDEVLRQFRDDLLGLLHRSGLVAVVLDVSGVGLMDGEDFRALRKIIAMTELMGSRCIVAGLRAGVVASLVELDVDLEDLETTLNLDAAFVALESEGEVGLTPDGPVFSEWQSLLEGEGPVPWDLDFHRDDDVE